MPGARDAAQVESNVRALDVAPLSGGTMTAAQGVYDLDPIIFDRFR